MTIILTSFAFSLLGGLASVIYYNPAVAINNTFKDNDLYGIAITKNVVYKDQELAEFNFSQSELHTMQKEFKNNSFYPLKSNIEGSFTSMFATLKSTYYYGYNINGNVDIDESLLQNFHFDLLVGRLPVKNKEDNEIAIPFYIYEHFADSINLDIPQVEKPEDMLNRMITIDSQQLKVVGIVDTHLDNQYSILKKGVANTLENSIIIKGFNALMRSYLHNVVFTRKGYSEEHYISYGAYNTSSSALELAYGQYFTGSSKNDIRNYNAIYGHTPNDVIWINQSLRENGVIIDGGESSRDEFNYTINKIVQDFVLENFSLVNEYFTSMYDYVDYIMSNEENQYQPKYNSSYFFELGKNEYIRNFFPSKSIYLISSQTNIAKNYPVAGISFAKRGIYVSKEKFNEIIEYHNRGLYKTIFVSLARDNYKLISYFNEYNEKTAYSANS